MKYCTNCGSQLQGAPKFCQDCGQPTGADTPGAAIDSRAPAKEPSPEVQEKKEGFFVSLYAPVFHEHDLNKLLRLFLYVSIFDAALVFVFKLFNIIPELAPTPLSPIGYLVGELVITAIFYSILRYWGVAKRAKLAFVICIAFTALLLGFAWTDDHVQEFTAYLHTGPKFAIGAVAFYEHFLSGLFVEMLIMIRMLVLLNQDQRRG
jgi:hypothetical protein